MPGRAGGYGHVFAFADDAFTVETTGREHRVLDHDGPHTNHYLDPDLAALSPPPSEGSRARLTRLRELVEERRPATPEALMDLMRDPRFRATGHLPSPRARRGRRGVSGVFSMVADVAAKRMWVTAGNPCQYEYVQVDLADLAP